MMKQDKPAGTLGKTAPTSHLRQDLRQRLRTGFSLLELILFLGILTIIMGTAIMMLISVQESRLRQQSVADVEQRGAQLLETFTRNIRRAEIMLAPAANQTGSILALQMGLNAEFPTIFASSATGNLLFIKKNSVLSLLNSQTQISRLSFRNVAESTVVVSFDLTTMISLPRPQTYTRHFDATATLFPDDQSESGGCGSCPAPSCVSHQYKWYHCQTDVCTLSTATFAC